MWGDVRVGIKHHQEDQSKNLSRQLTVVFREIAQSFSSSEVVIHETEEVATTPINFYRSNILGLSVVVISFYNDGWLGLHWVHYMFLLIFLLSLLLCFLEPFQDFQMKGKNLLFITYSHLSS